MQRDYDTSEPGRSAATTSAMLLGDAPAPSPAQDHGWWSPRRARRGYVLRRLLLFADVLALVVCLALSLTVVGGRSDALTGVAWGLLLLPVWVLIFKIYGLYDRDGKRISHSTVDEAPWVFHAVVLGSLGLWLFSKLTPLGRLTIWEGLSFFVLTFVGVLCARSAARELVRASSAAERVLLVGSGPVARLLVRKLRTHPEYGLRPVGYISEAPGEYDPLLGDIACLGSINDLEAVCLRSGTERVLLAPTLQEEALIDLIRRTRGLEVRVSLVPNVVDVLGPSVEIDDVEGITVLGMNPPTLNRSSRLLKRGMDVAISTVCAITTLPLVACIALAIRLTSPGPALFAQERVGRDGRYFRLYKFRTMVQDAESRVEDLKALSADSGWLLLDNDPRITRLGGILRRTSLDELPQLWNVIRGDMSLVGPRPLTPRDHANVSEWGRRRLDLTPGVTGLWQVLGRTTIPFEEMVKLDYLYVTNWSLWGDVRLLIRTLPAVLRRQGAN